jgi:hypothetical protein
MNGFPNLLAYINLLIAITQVTTSFDAAAPDASNSTSRDYLSRLALVWLQGTLTLTKNSCVPPKYLTPIDVRMPIILMMGFRDIPMSVKGMKAGAVDVLTKPIRNSGLA